jgi:PglZ domain
MSVWIDRILKEFPADLSRLWIAADPDQVLLDERILAGLRTRGFDVLPFEDSIVFRAEFEERYRAAWDRGEEGPAKSLIIHVQATTVSDLPWDYLRQARPVNLSLADLFPKLSYVVIRQLGPEYLEPLFSLQSKQISQPLGETSTKDFILTHIFQFSPHVISSRSDFWRDLLRMQNRAQVLPSDLADRVAVVLSDNDALHELPIHELFASKSTLLRFIQNAWIKYLIDAGVRLPSDIEPPLSGDSATLGMPFDHPDVRVIIQSMFLNGTLHAEAVKGVPANLPEWARIGVTKDPDEQRNLVTHGIESIMATMPNAESSHRDWTQLASRLGEAIARFHLLDSVRADSIKDSVGHVQNEVDRQLRAWVADHYADLPSLPATKGPTMVHHIPRYLAYRRDAGERRIALLVFDGMAVDQWIQIRDTLSKQSRTLGFDEGACFAWLPTLTSVSRQALFSGLKPREFSLSIDTTSQEPVLWSRFWQDQGLRADKVFYRKGIKRTDQLKDLEVALDSSTVEVAGIIINTVDDFVHGSVLGKRGIANQIEGWVESGFVHQLLALLLDKGFDVYLTSDHGNHESVGQGRPNQGVASELRGERVRIYNNETLAEHSCASLPQAFRSSIAGLPSNFLPMFAAGDSAFVTTGEHIVAHGGMSIDELIVPFIKVNRVKESS